MQMYEYINGRLVQMSAEDEAECMRIAEEETQKNTQPTVSERITELEAALAALLEGRTE